MNARPFNPPLTCAEWAWQFLRRNPEYQSDYRWFARTWESLEHDYGAPPQRDFFRWKQDPRAWRCESEIALCGSETCVVQDDKVLIECWMGAKWGFRKFPLSPHIDRPVMGLELDWRDTPVNMHERMPDSSAERVSSEMWLSFDLNTPLNRQLESARILLASRQRALAKSGALLPRNAREGAQTWQRWLGILDALDAGKRPEMLAIEQAITDIDVEIAAARAMTTAGYRRLIALNPEKSGD